MLKKSVVIKRKKMNLPRFNCKNLIFYILFVCGFIIGILTMKGEENSLKSVFSEFFTNYLANQTQEKFLSTFFNAVTINIILPFFTFVFGLCAVGIPIIIAIPALSGITVGMAIGFLYSSYSLQGLGYATLIIIPSVAIVGATLIRCCTEAIRMSIEIIADTSGYQTPSKQNELKDYCFRFLIFFIPLVLSALLEVGCLKLFSGLFSFI